MARWVRLWSRFYHWCKAGIWQQILNALQQRADRQGQMAWSLHFIDSTIVRAHQHVACARKAGRQRGGEALGRSRGGLSTKIHIRVEGIGKPVTFALTGSEVSTTVWPSLSSWALAGSGV